MGGRSRREVRVESVNEFAGTGPSGILLRTHEWWDRHFLDVAEVASRPSKDPSRRVGAVIVDTARRQIGSGYNGFPRGVRDSADRYSDKSVKLRLVVHAEANAIYNSSASLIGGVLYCTSFTCSECAKAIIQSGIMRVVCPTPVNLSQRWQDDAQFSRTMFAEAGVLLDEITNWRPSAVSEERLR